MKCAGVRRMAMLIGKLSPLSTGHSAPFLELLQKEKCRFTSMNCVLANGCLIQWDWRYSSRMSHQSCGVLVRCDCELREPVSSAVRTHKLEVDRSTWTSVKSLGKPIGQAKDKTPKVRANGRKAKVQADRTTQAQGSHHDELFEGNWLAFGILVSQPRTVSKARCRGSSWILAGRSIEGQQVRIARWLQF